MVPARAAAQDATAVAAARALGQEGVVAAREGRCEEAVDKLQRAKSLVPVPTIIVPLAECQIKLGRIVAGVENLLAVARENLPDNAPELFVKAQQRARELLPKAQARIGKLNVSVEAPPGTTFAVTDNGSAISDSLMGVDRPADPGGHTIVVDATGFLSVTKQVQLGEGATEKLVITLEPDPSFKPTPDDKATPLPPTTESSGSALVPVGAVIAGVGGIGLILGGAFGGVAAGTKSDLDEVCATPDSCPPERQEDIGRMKTFATASTASFVIGGVLAATGITMLAVGLAGGSEAPPATARLRLGGGFAGLEIGGTF